MKSKRTLLVAIFTVTYFFSIAQKSKEINIPKVNQPSPDFKLSDIQYYSKRNASLKDFRNQWLILDFWSRGCRSCVESFPKLNSLRKEFEGKVEFILVGKDDKYIRNMYERFRKHYNLNIPVTYDTVLFKEFQITTVPHVIWIDGNGIVRQITTQTELTKSNISALINGGNFADSLYSDSLKIGDIDSRLNPNLPLFSNGNGQLDYKNTYSSILCPWKNEMGQNLPDFSNWTLQLPNGIQFVGATVEMLYEAAFMNGNAFAPWNSLYGIYARHPVLEVSDISQFEFDYNSGKNIYCYSLIIPQDKATSANLQVMMQNDLKRYFGYNVTVEERMMPYWALVTTSKQIPNKLITKGGKPVAPDPDSEFAGFTIKNQSLKYLITKIFMFHQDEPPFIDETGISSNIDLTLNAVLTDFEDIKNNLRRNGLDLVKKQMMMKVIVIRNEVNRY